MAPPEKKQKTEGEKDEEMPDAAKEEEAKAEPAPPKEPEPPKELEVDAPAAKGPKNKDPVQFLVPDTTVNVMPTTVGSLLLALSDGGMNHLLAGARASVGVKSGRYMFEVKIVEYDKPQDNSRGPWPRNMLKVGFSTAGSSLLGEGEGCISFDSEGFFAHSGIKNKVSVKLAQDSVVACLLNLDENSPNFNTVSLFKDGARASPPQALPDDLKGKPLFPTVSFKNMSLHTNFGPAPICPLPFECLMLQDAAKADSIITSYPAPPKDGKYEVVFPVSLPDEGSFDWLDMFLEKNPQYTELSDRVIRDWIEKSSYWKNRLAAPKSSNDKPEMNFGVKELDDGCSVRRMLQTVCPMQKRNFVVMEVKGNLLKEERQALLAPFKAPGFKTVAQVLVGEPPVEFKKRSQEMILKQKQDNSDKEFKAKQEAERRRKQFEKRQKELEKQRKKAEKERLKRAKAQAKALEAAKKAALEKAALAKEKAALEKTDGEKKDGEEEKKEEEEKKDKDEEKKEEKEEKEESEEEEEPEEDKEEEEPEAAPEDPPKVALTPEEKKMSFRKGPIPDLAPYFLSTSFVKFSVPDADEGFDDIKYVFSKADKCNEYMKQWVLDRKLTTRVEDAMPSAWFNTKYKEWQKAFSEWHAAQNKYKASLAKKAQDKARKVSMAAKKWLPAPKVGDKQDGQDQKAAEEKKDDKKEEPKEDTKEEDKEEEAEEAEPEVDFDAVDVFGTDDVMDIGGGVPLFRDFSADDWTLMGLAFELHLLAHAFRRDAKDPERSSIHVDHMDFYYTKFFKNALSPQQFGVENFRDLLKLVKDVVYINKQNIIENTLDAEMENYQVFVKITEEARRFRNIRLDFGDESAKLKIQSLRPTQPVWTQQGSSWTQQGAKRKVEWTPAPASNQKWGSWQGGGGRGGGGNYSNYGNRSGGNWR